MITTLTDGLAILAIRHNFFYVLINLARLFGLLATYILLPLALIGWGIWAVFFAPSDEVNSAPTPQSEIVETAESSDTTATSPAPVTAPVQPAPLVVSSSNAELLKSEPPRSRREHLNAARAAVSGRQPTQAAYNIKMVMQYDLQVGRELSKQVRDLMKDALFIGMDTADIGNFARAASEKYKSQWSASEQRTYEMMQSLMERSRN